ncbi:hypothetical protein EVAR_31074_1 [Eumeta japonica]|uniref:UMA domain-containing protein n=1 Tax=Eumeta variegata TaxID=151549 RepID=A0A4C1XD25_EUMVA|nr:hypothetical protein EVAR_31074_1 [Eumeta japonica]
MSHFGDYMDGVPVKISDKYKRPLAIELPYSIIECPSRSQQLVDSINYCPTFESNVLAKIKELRKAKETKKNERIYRLRIIEEAKQKQLDLIAAAEAEEKLKQLSVSEVSYPSTEEISEISPDDREKNSNVNVPQELSSDLGQSEVAHTDNYSMCNPVLESQPNILQPIQVLANYQPANLLDDPDPLQELKLNKQAKVSLYNRVPSKHVDKMTFSDFENDTSSPFDNVELKTINDMELLAQVLQDQHSTTGCLQPQHQFYANQTYQPLPNCTSQAQIENVAYVPVPTTYMEQPIQDPAIVYAPEPYSLANGYYMPAETICDSTLSSENVNLYMPNYQYYVPTSQYQPIDPNYYAGQSVPVDSNELVSQLQGDQTFVSQPYYFQYPQVPIEYASNYNTGLIENLEEKKRDNSSNSCTISTSKLRSVPDIVKELDEELKSAKLRANDRSYNASPAPKVTAPHSSSIKKSKRKIEKLPNPYNDLPSSSQSICKKIQAMGFPLDRVARICTEVGDNDKRASAYARAGQKYGSRLTLERGGYGLCIGIPMSSAEHMGLFQERTENSIDDAEFTSNSTAAVPVAI